MSRLRVGCVGAGFIAGRHLAALSAMPDVEIVAIADSDQGRASVAAERFGGRVHDDALVMLAQEDLDAVWLCVPPFAHGPVEEAIISRDLPFFVEKPIGMDLATANRIAQAVRQRNLPTAVGYHWRSLDVVQQARDIVKEAPPQLVLGHWLDATPAAPWWSSREVSGGQLIEQTTHLFDLVRLLVGEVETVQALEAGPVGERSSRGDVPVASVVVLQFSTGAIGTISSSCLLDRRHLVGLRLVSDGQLLDLGERSLSDHELRLVDGTGERLIQSNQDPVAREDRCFVDVLKGGPRADSLVSYDEALRTHALVCAADQAAREAAPDRTGAKASTQIRVDAPAPAPPGLRAERGGTGA